MSESSSSSSSSSSMDVEDKEVLAQEERVMEEEELVSAYPSLTTSDLLFKYTCDSKHVDREAIASQLLEAVEKDEMGPFYKLLCDTTDITVDKDLLAKLEAKNAETTEKLKQKIKDAEEQEGETEVREALLALSAYYARIGDKDNALSSARDTMEKTIALTQKIDLAFFNIRIGIFFNDKELVRRNLDKARTLEEEGSDWERRNRLKAYEAWHFMQVRNFEAAAERLLSTLSTYTATELMEFDQFVWYAVLMAQVATDRTTVGAKVINAPEVLQVIDDLPNLHSFLDSLYNCKYDEFLVAFAGILDQLEADKVLSQHLAYFSREMRVVVYSQYLESYRTVSLASMASSFGVGEDFLDAELSRFIASGRLNAQIDKVDGVITTNRPDSKNALYQKVIKQGDQLLNRIQKLSMVTNVG